MARRISGVGTVTVSERRSIMFARSRVLPAGFDRADETFLDDRCRERAVVAVDESFREAAATLGRRTLLVVQQPFVGLERPVEPHRMVEAGDHEPVVVPGTGV